MPLPQTGAQQVAADQAGVADEPALVERIRSGDREAFDTLARAYYRPLRGYVYGLVGSAAVAEELVQELFWNIWKMGAQWRVHTSLAGYLFHGIRLLASNDRRRRRLSERWEHDVLAHRERSTTEGMVASADALVEAKELHAELRRALDQLPLNRRQIVVLRYVHGYSCPRVAEILGLTVKAVEHQSAKAQRTLRATLASFLDE